VRAGEKGRRLLPRALRGVSAQRREKTTTGAWLVEEFSVFFLTLFLSEFLEHLREV